jgi:hypothetical protein
MLVYKLVLTKDLSVLSEAAQLEKLAEKGLIG